jgi:hypothetical protein
MKNWSVEYTRNVKKWLDIDTYRRFEDLPLIQLYGDLMARIQAKSEVFKVKAISLNIFRVFSRN